MKHGVLVDKTICTLYCTFKQGVHMISTTATNFRKNIFGLLEQTIKYNEAVTINTKNGNAVLMSEEDYKGMIETLYLMSIPGMEEKIINGLNTPIEECIKEDEVIW